MALNPAGHDRYGGLALLVATALIAMPSWIAQCQSYVSFVTSSPIVAAPGEPMPTYEVATIKPWDEKAGRPFGLPLRIYIQRAFGIPLNTTACVIGPDWISSVKYVIEGKPPDSIRDAMQTMSREQRSRETGLMQQSLLADRFKLKAHWETREMPVYELVPAKGGPKLKETTDPTHAQAAMGSSAVRAKAAPMHVLIDTLEAAPDIGGRVVIDKTGLTGLYDFSLKWTPMEAAGGPGGSSGTPSIADEGASLFTAIEEQLGLKLVSTNAPGQVLVIDHIERPSEN